MSEEYDSWSRRFNRAVRESRGITFEPRSDTDKPNTMSGLIRSAVDRKRGRVDQAPADRGGPE